MSHLYVVSSLQAPIAANITGTGEYYSIPVSKQESTTHAVQ